MRRWHVGCFLLALAACGNEDETQVTGGGGQVAAAGSGADVPAEPTCVENPVTHLEIINACSTYARVRKAPQLTLLEPDGSLPPP